MQMGNRKNVAMTVFTIIFTKTIANVFQSRTMHYRSEMFAHNPCVAPLRHHETRILYQSHAPANNIETHFLFLALVILENPEIPPHTNKEIISRHFS